MTEDHRPGARQRPQRRDRLIQEHDHDPYLARGKHPSPTVCPQCGAVYLDGRWTWEQAPEGAGEHLCPACERIRDAVPAAFLTLQGEFLQAHEEEIMHLIHNYEQRERAEHPLKRIMGRQDQDDGVVFTFTDPHLARGIGEAVHHAYQGDLKYEYEKGETLLRVYWQR